MKKLAFKMIPLLVVVLGAPMIIPGPDGKPIMSLDDWIPHELIASLRSGSKKIARSVEGAEEKLSGGDQIYSWRDEQGVLHYSDTPVEGAAAVDMQGNTLEIPAERFVQHGLAPARDVKPSGGKRAFLLKEKAFPASRNNSNSGKKGKTSEASLADLEALASGDLSSAGNVLKNLPELLEQAKQARQIEPEARR